jgi:Ni/Co efflux regulator RcnB
MLFPPQHFGDRTVSYRILRIALPLVSAIGVGAPLSHATPPDHGGKHSHAADAATLVQPDVDYDAIRSIAVSEHHTGYKGLPPGIAKNLARGKPLPPGIAKKAVPSTIVQHLPTYPDYEWTRCGTDLVLIQIATRVVADVLTDIFK